MTELDGPALIVGDSARTNEALAAAFADFSEVRVILVPPPSQVDGASAWRLPPEVLDPVPSALVIALDAREAADVAQTEVTTWHATLDHNAGHAFRLCRAVLPAMGAQGRGRIVALSSTASQNGARRGGAYAASKAALEGLIRCVGLEGAPQGVTANIVLRSDEVGDEAENPASRPLGRAVTQAEIAATCRLLCDPRAGALAAQTVAATGGSVT